MTTNLCFIVFLSILYNLFPVYAVSGSNRFPVFLQEADSIQDSAMIYLENENIKLGVDLNLGGAVTYLTDKRNGGENMINSYDWGRQIQMSFYSGPWPYIGPNGEKPTPEWSGLGWNPIQAGDAGGHRSKILSYEKKGNHALLVRSVPMQWPHKTGVAGECVFETLYTLSDYVITMEATIINNRSDTTQYRVSSQEMPAVYTNGSWYKLVTYLGDKPFQNEPTTVIVDKNDDKGWPWLNFYTPENWVALLDDNGYGIGVFQPEVMTFNGGFHPNKATKGFGGEKDFQTGHIAPIGKQILDHNIRWTYKTTLILGTLDDIRGYATKHSEVSKHPEWVFTDSRENWYFLQGMKDAGFPLQGGLDVQFDSQGTLVGPVTFWQAKDNPYVEIEGEFTSQDKEVELTLTFQPYGPADNTDWLNWSEGDFTVENEKKIKADKFPHSKEVIIKKLIKADGVNQKLKIDLTSDVHYKGAMKNLKIAFNKPGSAHITHIKLLK